MHAVADFERRARSLEHEAGEALVPGDARAWARTVGAELAVFRRRLDAFARDRAELGDQILSEDPGLSARVEAMRDRDRELVRRGEKLATEIDELRRRPLETAGARAKELRHELFHWLADCRSLELEARSWLAEAHYRDRGVQD